MAIKFEPTNSNELETLSWLMIYGAPKVGKTSTAATASAFYPEKIGPKKVPTVLEDCIMFQYDRGGAEALTDLGLSMPVFDFSTCTTMLDLTVKESSAFTWVKAHAKASPEKIFFLIVDTASARDFLVVQQYEENHSESKNKARMYGEILQAHSSYVSNLRSLPNNVRLIILVHAKGSVTYTKDTTPEASKIAEQGEVTLIQPSLTGKGASAYKKDAFVLWLNKSSPKGRPVSRQFLTRGTPLIEAGGRGENRLNEYEPADLRKLYKKLGVKL